MKWHALNIYIKVATVLGAISALVLAAGADLKWT